ncbi:MAG: hypothetical protein CMA79_00265 [Euryarchaeota archaeon]|nr:hypothetical protein [Euryarchaeota archaeon]MEC9457845.1 hypothetical protein [Candidatus Thermoplasmatota archaeon]MED5398383.1 hypothetical protein [Candidatus Thermoplasmatota archaeon]|tara:strand:+ start:396 stop:794 length:399 start_codon:yes stop_codon:yes gene_type:complete
MSEDNKPLAAIATASALTASMCCLPSVIWVLFAGSSAIVAANELSNDLYYSWVRLALYAVSLCMLIIGLVIYFRNRGICDIDDLRRERRRVVNTSLALFAVTVLGYLVWNYVVLEVVGIALGLPWEESAFWK